MAVAELLLVNQDDQSRVWVQHVVLTAEEGAEQMWGTVGQMAAPQEQKVLFSCSSPCVRNSPALTTLLALGPSLVCLVSSSGQADRCLWHGLCVLRENQSLSCVLAAASQRAELGAEQEGHVSPSSWKGAAPWCTSSNAPAELVGPGWLIFKKMSCTVTQTVKCKYIPHFTLKIKRATNKYTKSFIWLLSQVCLMVYFHMCMLPDYDLNWLFHLLHNEWSWNYLSTKSSHIAEMECVVINMLSNLHNEIRWL